MNADDILEIKYRQWCKQYAAYFAAIAYCRLIDQAYGESHRDSLETFAAKLTRNLQCFLTSGQTIDEYLFNLGSHLTFAEIKERVDTWGEQIDGM